MSWAECKRCRRSMRNIVEVCKNFMGNKFKDTMHNNCKQMAYDKVWKNFNGELE